MAARTFWPSTHLSLLQRIRRPEDQEAWEFFVDLYGPLIYRFCRQRGLQSADADDVTQEVFKEISRAMRTFQLDRERGRFRNWLGTVTQNEIIRFVKKSQRPGKGVGGPALDEGLASLTLDAQSLWIEEFNAHVSVVVLERLKLEFDAETWCAFEMLWLNDQPSQQVADQLQRPINWVYRAKFRVLKRLREEVEALASDITGLGDW
jgi:RNA polymerase sigma-70 factor, ECF subfamily